MRVRAHVIQDWSGGHRFVLIRDKIGTGKIDVLADFKWEEHFEGDMFDPSAGLPRSDEMLQAIMDAAWQAGFRPVGFADIKNETNALREHLADMKAITFHQLKIGAANSTGK